MNRLRTIILDSINAILTNSANKDDVIARLGDVYKNTLEIQNAFLIENIVFGQYIHLLLDNDVTNDPKQLQTIRDELLGQQPCFHTYALRYSFIELLDREFLMAYQGLLSMCDFVEQKAKNIKVEEIPENYDDLRENLFLLYKRLKAGSIADVLVIQACHILFSIPDDKQSFNITEWFGSIRTRPSITTIDQQLSYIKSLLNKLIGDDVLYVDTSILPDTNFMINLR
jgi:hypothetical protein